MRRPRKKGTTGSTSDSASESSVATMAEQQEPRNADALTGTQEAQDTAPQSVGDTSVAAPDRDRIAMRAYELYLERGAGDGRDFDDWLTAEREFANGRDRRGDSSE